MVDDKIKKEIRAKFDKITATFGMRDTIVAEAMNLKLQVVRNKKTANHRDFFNQKNLDDLILYIKENAKQL